LEPQAIGQQHERSARELLWRGARDKPSQRLAKSVPIRRQGHARTLGEELGRACSPAPVLGVERPLRFGESDGVAFSAAPSRCAHIARTVGAANRNAEAELRSKGISHASIACMRVTLKSVCSAAKNPPLRPY